MKRRMKPISQCDGPVQLLLVDLVGGDRQLAGVVEQVVEQDLGREHRQEAPGTADAPAALNMFPKLLDVPIRTYLIVFAKIRRPSVTPSASTSRSFSSSRTSAASFATSAAASTEMPTSAACRARASFTPSPRNATPPPLRRCTRTIRAFCSGVTRAKTLVRTRQGASCSSSAASTSAPVDDDVRGQPQPRAHLPATTGLSPVTILIAIPSSASRCSAGLRRLRRVEEHQQADGP